VEYRFPAVFATFLGETRWRSLREGRKVGRIANNKMEKKNMRTRNIVTAVALASGVIAGSAVAATISNLSGQSCGNLTGTWHFVNNQTGGAAPGQLTASWSGGDTCTVGAAAVNANMQHFYCTASGTLTGASTNLPGRLVLSHFTCESKEEPPKEDPPKK
jgi:hypothetical protein